MNVARGGFGHGEMAQLKGRPRGGAASSSGQNVDGLWGDGKELVGSNGGGADAIVDIGQGCGRLPDDGDSLLGRVDGGGDQHGEGEVGGKLGVGREGDDPLGGVESVERGVGVNDTGDVGLGGDGVMRVDQAGAGDEGKGWLNGEQGWLAGDKVIGLLGVGDFKDSGGRKDGGGYSPSGDIVEGGIRDGRVKGFASVAGKGPDAATGKSQLGGNVFELQDVSGGKGGGGYFGGGVSDGDGSEFGHSIASAGMVGGPMAQDKKVNQKAGQGTDYDYHGDGHAYLGWHRQGHHGIIVSWTLFECYVPNA